VYYTDSAMIFCASDSLAMHGAIQIYFD